MTSLRGWCRWSAAIVALAIVVASCVTVARPSAAQTAPTDPTTTEVLAIVAPVASPACSASGLATLLVPIVGGLANQQLGDNFPSVADLILNALGPVYIACGTLPAAPGTRCQIDDQIAELVPTQISSVTGPTPGLLGDVTDALNAALKVLGLQPADALQKALVCEIPAGASAVDAPPAPAPLAPAAVPTTRKPTAARAAGVPRHLAAGHDSRVIGRAADPNGPGNAQADRRGSDRRATARRTAHAAGPLRPGARPLPCVELDSELARGPSRPPDPRVTIGDSVRALPMVP